MKYPRTYHLPWSKGISSDDKIISSLSNFIGKEIVVTEKMDGENTTMTRNKCYARSLDSVSHESRTWVKSQWAKLSYFIPESYRVCGENLYAKHSIFYMDLKSYFYGFSIWENDRCLSWDDTLMWFTLLDIVSVPVLYRGVYDEDTIKRISIDENIQEGYVVRITHEFNISDFPICVGKYVRKNHVNTNEHWMNQKIIPNKLRD